MHQITFKNLIERTVDHPEFENIISKRLGTGTGFGSGYPGLKKQMSIFADYLTTSGGATELTFEINAQGELVRSIHHGASVEERTYTPHDSSKRGKLRTCREVTGQVNHDRISAPLNDSRWSGVTHSSWSIIGSMVQELYSLLDSVSSSQEEVISSSPHAEIRERLKERFRFLDKYAPEESEVIYTKMWEATESVISKMQAELAEIK